MKNHVIYAAVSGIDESYLADTENMPEIKAEFQRDRKRKSAAIVGICACFIVIVGMIGMPKIIDLLPHDPSFMTPGGATNQPAFVLTPFAAKNDPNVDAYGEDELHEVRVTVFGVTYRQLTAEDYESYHIPDTVTKEAFGEYIGNVVERFPQEEPNAPVSSPEPSLADAALYYYAPASCKAVVIAEKDGQCSVFAVSDWGRSQTFRDACAFYGASPSADGIESISYTVQTLEGNDFRVTASETITDAKAINDVCALLLQLTPEEPPEDERFPSPGWYSDAWQAYKDDPGSRVREDITLEIRFCNGTVMRNILYQPFIGNGYVDGMKELSPEQNEILRSLLK